MAQTISILALFLLATGCSSGADHPPTAERDAGTADGGAGGDASEPPPDAGVPDPCALAEATRSYMGCEYFAAPLAQSPELDERSFDYRIVVANPSAQLAHVSVWRGELLEAQRTVVPGGAIDIPLPWIDGVSFPFGPTPWQSSVVEDGAYRVVSDRPVIVSQLNPFDYSQISAGGVRYSYTNDASLLLPTHALGEEHVAASYMPYSSASADGSGSRYPGWIAVIGVAEEPTEIEIDVTSPVAADAGGRWGETAAGETIRFTIGRGEVAQVAAAVPPDCTDLDTGFCFEPGYDITGSVVRASRPVAAFSGHSCANVPVDVPACDHLETQLMPVNTWGQRLETMPMRDAGTRVGNLLRIIAARDGTIVTLDPPIGSIAETQLDAGEHVELQLGGAVSISANEPIQVAQLLLGQNITDPPLDRGDPALTILVPAEQFRYDYVFVTPTSYTDVPDGKLYLLVSREPGVPIELDGADVSAEWTATGDRELALVPVSGGAHRARSTSPFGLVAYGLGRYTSFAYPAGLDLHILH